MALIDDLRPSDFGGGESDFEPAFRRNNFGAACAAAEGAGPADEAKSAATVIGEKAEQATEAIGAGMESVGRSIREHAPEQGVLGNAGRAVGDKIEAGGHYLEAQGLKGMCNDLTNTIRSNPIPALCVAFGIGFLAVRLFRR